MMLRHICVVAAIVAIFLVPAVDAAGDADSGKTQHGACTNESEGVDNSGSNPDSTKGNDTNTSTDTKTPILSKGAGAGATVSGNVIVGGGGIVAEYWY